MTSDETLNVTEQCCDFAINGDLDFCCEGVAFGLGDLRCWGVLNFSDHNMCCDDLVFVLGDLRCLFVSYFDDCDLSCDDLVFRLGDLRCCGVFNIYI